MRAVPRWLLARWRDAFGEDAAAAIAAATTRPARPFVVDLRAWGRRADAAAGLVPGGREIVRGDPEAGEPVAGPSVAVDQGAAIVARLAADAPEGPAADLAAAPGGKTLLLAWRRAGPTVALEPHPGRARALARRLTGADLPSPVALVRADARTPPLVGGRFATVLLDAPCSGTGTLRRRPERRVRVTAGDVARAAALQRALLDGAARLVAPGGRLVYAVCSLEPEEGIEQVRSFLVRHPEFDLDDAPARLGAEAASLADPREPRCLLTRPDLGPWEGFQAACLVLRSGRARASRGRA
ncbi:MAG: hypothetical protein D6738_14150 [Acidobacteria bacterium]|nr:MAG: hypothetical protein D6738_14150 [Acidobacteriota bacterium]